MSTLPTKKKPPTKPAAPSNKTTKTPPSPPKKPVPASPKHVPLGGGLADRAKTAMQKRKEMLNDL